MTIATPIKNSAAIAFGIGKIYLDSSVTYIAQFSSVLGDSSYIGAHTEVSIEGTKELLEMTSSRKGFREVVKRIVSSAQVSINCNILELTTKNMSYSFGGSGGVTNILNDLFGIPAILRAELVFLYPDKVTQMIIILPSVQVVSNPSLGFNSEEAMGSSITLSPLATDSAVWAANPLGRVYWA